jgi:hypothetical protein
MNAQDSFPVAEWRARWIHDPWYVEVGSDRPSQFRAMPNADKRYGIHEMTQAEIDRTINEIRHLQDRAFEMRLAILDALAASRKRGA